MAQKMNFQNNKVIRTIQEFYFKIIQKIGIDGLLHTETSALILLFFNSFLPLWVANIITLVIGIIKEIIDKVTQKGTAEWRDIFYDIIGIIIANLIALISLI